MALKSNGVTQVPDGLGPPGKVLRVNSAGTAGEWGDPVISTKSDVEGLGIDVPATNLTGTIPAARLSTATTQAESDDSTKIATTAYVVDKITTLIGGAPSTLNDLNELAAAINDDANYNSTLTTALATKLPLAGGTMTGDVLYNDNVKAKFGAGSDLLVYHDGTHSYIRDNGTGELRLEGENSVRIGSVGSSETYIMGQKDGAVRLYHDNAEKLATTAAGITVTGEVRADVIYLGDGEFFHAGNSGDLKIGHVSNESIIRSHNLPLNIDGNSITFRGYSPYTRHMHIAQTGDISFYDDTGANAKFFWDASAESLGIGTSSPSAPLHVYGPNYPLARIERQTSLTNALRSTFAAVHTTSANMVDGFGADISFIIRDSANVDNEIANFGARRDGADNSGSLVFATTLNGTQQGLPKMILKPSGNVGIGTTSPSGKLHVSGGNNQVAVMAGGDVDNPQYPSFGFDGQIGSNGGRGAGMYLPADGTLAFSTAGSERMRIDSSGNVGIGTTDPKANFQVIGPATSSVPAAGSGAVGGAIFSADLNTYGMFIGSINSGNGYIQQQRTNAATYYDLMLQPNGGNVGIGTSSPGARLSVSGPAALANLGGGSTGSAALYVNSTSGHVGELIQVLKNGATKMHMANDGKLGIGTSSPSNQLHLQKSADTGIVIENSASSMATLSLLATGAGRVRSSATLIFDTGGSTERMRIDASGNVLISTTSINPHQDGSGIALRENAGVIIGVDGTHAIIAARHNSDGEVIRIQRDNTTVGTIGTNGGNPYFAQASKGIGLSSARMYPVTNTGAVSDNTMDIGNTNARFKDVYLSGIVTANSFQGKLDGNTAASNGYNADNNSIEGFALKRVTGGSNAAFSGHHNLIQIPNTSSGVNNYHIQIAGETDSDPVLKYRSGYGSGNWSAWKTIATGTGASTTLGAVGTYTVAATSSSNSSATAAGATVAGSTLKTNQYNSTHKRPLFGDYPTSQSASFSQSGTWRNMAGPATGAAFGVYVPTLWVRIS